MFGLRKAVAPLLGVGVLLGAVLATAIPAAGGTGDPVLIGKWNRGGATNLVSGATEYTLMVSNWSGSPAIRLVTNGPPASTNSTKRVRNWNADMVDGHHASDLVDRDQTTRVAWCGHTETHGDLPYACDMNVHTPVAGWLVLSGSAHLVGSDWIGKCRFRVDGTPVEGSERFVDMPLQGHVNPTLPGPHEICSTDAATYVEAGDHTIRFDVGTIGVPGVPKQHMGIHANAVFTPYSMTP
jgi:hypothetical protein